MDMGSMDMGGAGNSSGMDHAGHDHTAHDKYHGAVVRDADGHYFYTHGAFTGHMVPGIFFVLWGTWWATSTFASYLRSRAARKPFRSQAWHHLAVGPAWLRAAPLEPAVKVVLPLFGVLGELWLGHESYRRLYAEDGKFQVDNVNDWQHSLMYTSFITSGAVDLLGHYVGLPHSIEQTFLGLAFLCEMLLLVFHLKGPDVEILLHLILVLQVAATALAVVAESLARSSLLAASMRPYFTLLQGVWWIQTAYAMYTSDPAFDPDYMGGSMMVPAVFVLHMLWIAVAMLAALVTMRSVAARLYGHPIPWELTATQLAGVGHTALPSDDPELAVEMSSLMNKSMAH